ncbi:uncharacterized protein [Zea mays]|uniref:uncharacterized protein n=1 Tax=Zea mays TaxID=4577 RepID=UPI001652A421|nr:uncharacterized protein LOC118473175 [Zea mays]
MANTKIAVAIAILLALLQVSCAAARRHGKPAHGDHDGNGTPAVMTVNGFERGEDGGGAASCDGSFHSDDKLIVALSSRWYAGGKRCGEAIRITAESGRNREGTGRGRVRLPWRMPQQHRGFLPSRLEGAQARYGCRRGPRHVVRRLNTLHTELDGRPTTEKLGTTARGSVLPIVITTLSTYLIVERSIRSNKTSLPQQIVAWEKIKGPWGPPVKEIARDKNLRTTRGHPFCHGFQWQRLHDPAQIQKRERETVGLQYDLVGNPLGAVRATFERTTAAAAVESGGADPVAAFRGKDWGAGDLFRSFLLEQDDLGKVQVLDSSNLGLIKPDTLVRYRGMVQDMLGNEYYIGAFKVLD